jgi:TPR repeat protein
VSSRGRGPSRFGLGVALAALLGTACDRSPGGSEPQPAPSASVVQIGVAIGTCTDPSLCEAECDAGSADRCRRLAATYALGEGVGKDEARATALYERACAMKDAPACVFAGQMHEYAHGVPKDEAKATSLYETSCNAGWAAGCYNLAIMFENGRGVARDHGRAVSLYDTACAAGAKPACERAKGLRAAGD